METSKLLGKIFVEGDVFVSYRRVDVEFVKKLVEALESAGKNVWVDWDDIPPGSINFSDDIRTGLEGTDAFIAVLSPDYLESSYCIDLELGTAIELQKKIIPIVYRSFDTSRVPKGIHLINWIHFIPHAGRENTFPQAFAQVLEALNTDIEHTRQHKQYLLRALEWRRNDYNPSFLLAGDAITRAEEWLISATDKNPSPTRLHHDYIFASRQRNTRINQRMIAGVSIALLVSVILGLIAVQQFISASQARDEAQDAFLREVRSASISRSIALASTARETSAQDNIQALALALLAIDTDNPPNIAQRTLADIGYQPGARHYILAHEDIVNDIAYHPQAMTFASVSRDGTIAFWSSQTGELLERRTPSGTGLNAIAYHPDGDWLAVGDDMGNIVLYSDESEPLRFRAHNDVILAIAFHPNRFEFATAGADELIHVWSLQAENIATYHGHSGRVRTLAYHHEGTLLASGGADNTIRLWDTYHHEQIDLLQAHDGTVFAVAFHPHQDKLASAGADGIVHLWRIGDENPIHSFFEARNSLRAVAFTPDGNRLLTTSDDQIARLYDMNTLVLLQDYSGQEAFLFAGTTDPTNEHIVTGGQDGSIILWDIKSGNIVHENVFYQGTLYQVALSPSGEYLATSSEQGFINLTNTANQTSQTALITHDSPILQIQFIDDGNIISADSQGRVHLWNVYNAEPQALFDAHALPIFSLIVRDSLVASGGGTLTSSELFVWDLTTVDVQHNLSGRQAQISTLALSQDGTRLASADIRGHVILWDMITGEAIADWQAHQARIHKLAFMQGDNILLIASSDGTISQWDTLSHTLQRTYIGHTRGVRDIAISPDGTQFITASEDNTLLLWHIDELEAIRTYQGHTQDVMSVVFHPSGNQLFSVGRDSKLITWRLESISQLIDWIENNRFIRALPCSLFQRFEQEFGVPIKTSHGDCLP